MTPIDSQPSPDLTAIDAALFDLDGVLVDSRVAFARCINAALFAQRLPKRREDELHTFLGPPLHSTFAELGAGDKVQSCVDAYRARYRALAPRETTVVPGIPEVLLDLSRRMPLIVATSKARALAEPLLEALGLRHLFHAIVGPGLATENETKGATIRRAITRLSPERRSVMIGDRKFDVIGATEHGLPTIGVLWGIGSADELIQAGAAMLVSAPRELSSILGADRR